MCFFPQVVHAAVLDVAETGTHGRASTVHEDTFISPKLKANSIRMDKSFMFSVSSSGLRNIYYLGKLVTPN